VSPPLNRCTFQAETKNIDDVDALDEEELEAEEVP